jgi:hypothetical protein
MTEFAVQAASNGFKVIIAAADVAAHLPRMVASSTRFTSYWRASEGQYARWKGQFVKY